PVPTTAVPVTISRATIGSRGASLASDKRCCPEEHRDEGSQPNNAFLSRATSVFASPIGQDHPEPTGGSDPAGKDLSLNAQVILHLCLLLPSSGTQSHVRS